MRKYRVSNFFFKLLTLLVYAVLCIGLLFVYELQPILGMISLLILLPVIMFLQSMMGWNGTVYKNDNVKRDHYDYM